jgi:hypothetical protein
VCGLLLVVDTVFIRSASWAVSQSEKIRSRKIARMMDVSLA